MVDDSQCNLNSHPLIKLLRKKFQQSIFEDGISKFIYTLHQAEYSTFLQSSKESLKQIKQSGFNAESLKFQ